MARNTCQLQIDYRKEAARLIQGAENEKIALELKRTQLEEEKAEKVRSGKLTLVMQLIQAGKNPDEVKTYLAMVYPE